MAKLALLSAQEVDGANESEKVTPQVSLRTSPSCPNSFVPSAAWVSQYNLPCPGASASSPCSDFFFVCTLILPFSKSLFSRRKRGNSKWYQAYPVTGEGETRFSILGKASNWYGGSKSWLPGKDSGDQNQAHKMQNSN